MGVNVPEVGGDVSNWDEFRRLMPVTQRWSYLDHAAVAPISGPASDALSEWSHDAAINGDTSYGEWSHQMEQVRGHCARLIGAQTAEVAMLRNTTEGINLVAEGIAWQAGDNVVFPADEFPSNQYPWMNLSDRGVSARRVPTDRGRLDLERLAAACDDRTRIVSLSWISFCSGWRNDLQRAAEIAHGCGALLFLDAIQGLGIFPLDVTHTPIDFLAADGHKWLLGPEGAAVFFIRQEHLDRLRPLGLGWNSVVGAHDFSHIELRLKETAARYEGGSPNTPGLIALGASLELLGRFPIEAIAQRVLEVGDLAIRRLEEIGAHIHSDRRPERRSGIIVFDVPGRDPEQLRRECLARHVAISCRGGRLRISPHAYNNASDIDRLIGALSG